MTSQLRVGLHTEERTRRAAPAAKIGCVPTNAAKRCAARRGPTRASSLRAD